MEINELEKKAADLEDRIAKVEEIKKSIEQEKSNVISKGSYMSAGTRHDSDEQRALRYFGCSDAKQLLNVNTCDQKFSGVPTELKYLVMDLKKSVDVARFTAQVFHGAPVDRDTTAANVKNLLDTYYGKTMLAPRLKAFGSTVSGAGDEWVPTAVSSSYIEEYELERRVVGMLRQIQMPSDPFDLPVQNSVTIARIQGENASISEANFGTGKITLDAVKLSEFMILPEELNEDSAPAIFELARSEVVEAQGRAIETAVINGDTTGTHMDSDVAAASDARKAWKGLRKLALANSANGSTVDFSAAALSIGKCRSMRTAMGKFGVNVRELSWVVSSKVYQQMVGLAEVTTVDKFGPMATILGGALAALDGIPIYITEFLRDDLNASGVYDGVTVDKSGIMLVNTRRFYLGQRRPIRVKAVMDPTPPNDRWLLASWSRHDFKGHAQGAGEVSVVYGVNVL
jgi:HK97 family phage major capsid protein